MKEQADDRLLYVPVRRSRCGAIALRTGRLSSGERVGLAFTSEAGLAAALGPGQEWTRLAGWLVPLMFADIGAAETRIDPLTAPTAFAPAAPVAPATPAAYPTAPAHRRRSSRLRIAVARHAF